MGNRHPCTRSRYDREDKDDEEEKSCCYDKIRHGTRKRPRRNEKDKEGSITFVSSPVDERNVTAVHWPYETKDGMPKSLNGDVILLKKWFVWFTKGYLGGEVNGWSSRGWKNGLAFVAMMARIAPERIDFDAYRDRKTTKERIVDMFAFAKDELNVDVSEQLKESILSKESEFVEGFLLRPYLNSLQPALDRRLFKLARGNTLCRQRSSIETLRHDMINRLRVRKRTSATSASSGLEMDVSYFVMKSPIAIESDSDFDDFSWTMRSPALTPYGLYATTTMTPRTMSPGA